VNFTPLIMILEELVWIEWRFFWMFISGIPNALNVISNFPFLVIGLVGLVLCYRGNYFRLRYYSRLVFCSNPIYHCWQKSWSCLLCGLWLWCVLKAWKVKYGVGLASMLVWLLLQLDLRTIISSQMMLALCGIGCQWVRLEFSFMQIFCLCWKPLPSLLFGPF